MEQEWDEQRKGGKKISRITMVGYLLSIKKKDDDERYIRGAD